MVDRERRTAIVTGAGSEAGIGFAIARRLAIRGMHVAIVATGAHIHDRADTLRAEGWSVQGHVADLRDPAAVTSLMDQVAGADAIDVLVNNAGMVSIAGGSDAFKRLEDLTIEEWDDSMSRNVSSAFLMSKAVVPGMRTRGYGRIVHISSVTGPVVALERASVYAAGKAAMLGMARALALEVASAGITVNVVAPGWIHTASSSTTEVAAGAASPIGRSGTPDEVAAAVDFLTGRDASYITGSMLVVDGGNHVIENVSGR
jgi:3-oxoacyl-[acyl-carrier protein] reductase